MEDDKYKVIHYEQNIEAYIGICAIGLFTNYSTKHSKLLGHD